MRGFKQFLLRGNVVDLVVGIVIGAAFAGLVSAIVKDILTPLIGAIAKLPDFSALSLTIIGSKFSYGDFVNALLAFVIASASVYFLAENMMKSELLRAIQMEISRHDLSHYSDEGGLTVPGCPKCPGVGTLNTRY
jgi:large conductance mechanosensitive channel protein